MEHKEKVADLEHAILKDYSNIAGMVVMKDGKTVYEKYFNNATILLETNSFENKKNSLEQLKRDKFI